MCQKLNFGNSFAIEYNSIVKNKKHQFSFADQQGHVMLLKQSES